MDIPTNFSHSDKCDLYLCNKLQSIAKGCAVAALAGAVFTTAADFMGLDNITNVSAVLTGIILGMGIFSGVLGGRRSVLSASLLTIGGGLGNFAYGTAVNSTATKLVSIATTGTGLALGIACFVRKSNYEN